jgi:hypothetical protein
MPKALSAAAVSVCFFSAFGLCIPSAFAETITITVTGTIGSANANEGFDLDFDGVFGPSGASFVGDTVSVALRFDLSHEASTTSYLASNPFLPAFTEFIADSSPQSVEVQTTINGTTVTGWAGLDSPPLTSPSTLNELTIAPSGVVFWDEEGGASTQPSFFTSLNIMTGIPLPDGAVTQTSPQDLAILNQSIPTESFALSDSNSVQVFGYQPGRQFAFSATPSTLSIQLDGPDLFAPEPSTAVLGLSCLTILFAVRRREQRRLRFNRKSGEIR